MNQERCDRVREQLPDFVGRRLSPADVVQVEAHLETCPGCADEAALVGLLFAARPAAPPDLAGRIQGSARSTRRHAYHPWWGLAAASVAALALGIGVVSSGNPAVEVAEEGDVPGIVRGVEEASLWVADDGLVAGAPAFDGLSDEALLQLLDEMGADITGGAA